MNTRVKVTVNGKEQSLAEILEKHEKWLNDEPGGVRADLHGVDLHNVNLYGAILQGADLHDADLRCADLCYSNLSLADLHDIKLHGADLRGANLSNANLDGAYLQGANLRDADLPHTKLHNANLRSANLRYTILRSADMEGADLSNTNLNNAYLYGANLSYVNLSLADLCGSNLRDANLMGVNLCGANLYQANLRDAKNIPFIPSICPEEGSYIAYKKARDKIVVLEITADAKRSSATTRKCRASKAKVLRIEKIDGSMAIERSVSSSRDSSFIYTVGEIVEVKDFDADRWNECSTGIHHFINRQEAVDY